MNKKLNIKKILLLVISVTALVCFVFPASSVLAGKKNSFNRQKKIKEAALSELTRGEKIKTKTDTYVLLPQVKSKRENPAPSKKDRTYRTNQSKTDVVSSNILGNKGPFIIYKAGKTEGLSRKSIPEKNQPETYPVVLNQRTGDFGIVTRKIMVNLDRMEDAESVAEDFNIDLSYKFDYLSIAFYSAKKDQNLISLVNLLKKDSRVKEAEPEIIEDLNVPL